MWLLDVQITAHGPLLNPILPKETRPIALKWTLYDPTLNALPLYEIEHGGELDGVFRGARAAGAGRRRMWSTPTTRDTSPTTRWAGADAVGGGL